MGSMAVCAYLSVLIFSVIITNDFDRCEARVGKKARGIHISVGSLCWSIICDSITLTILLPRFGDNKTAI